MDDQQRSLLRPRPSHSRRPRRVRPEFFQKNAQAAHVFGVKPGAAWHQGPVPDGIRDSFQNLLLLCLAHQAEVDSDEDSYPPEKLWKWKLAHEGDTAAGLAPLQFADPEQAIELLIEIAEPVLEWLEAVTQRLEQTGEVTADTVGRQIIPEKMIDARRLSTFIASGALDCGPSQSDKEGFGDVAEQAVYAQLGFSDEEWGLLVGLPHAVLTAASAAESDSSRRTQAEGAAGHDTISQGRDSASPLVGAVAQELVSRLGDPEMGEDLPVITPSDPIAVIEDVLNRAHAAAVLLAAKVDEGEAGAYKHWLMSIAEQVVTAASSGGLLGLGGEQVTESERRFRDRLSAALTNG